MTGGRIILPLAEPCIANDDTLVVGATLTINVAGTGTLASLFADSGLSTPIANPQTSDSAGRFFDQTTVIWADNSQAYDCTLNYNNGTSFTFDTLYPLGPSPNFSGFAPINSPTFTGVPQAPTPASNDNSNKIATTGFVKAQGYAPLASPTFTGVPAGPTAAPGTNTTQLATTAFVDTAIGLTVPTGTTSGYTEFLGLILQWVTFSIGASPSATVTVTWPLAFPTAVLGTPWVAYSGSPGGGFALSASVVSTTSATFVKNSSDPSAHTGTIWALGQ